MKLSFPMRRFCRSDRDNTSRPECAPARRSARSVSRLLSVL